ncbi:MAG: Hint domain-containing protein [Tateyamaria sp.]|uniref:Hint domain-containing protein n=1 Tax=Tateyamaria sp. TaxID=1929288 RepID=UPI00329FECB1
MSWIGLTDHTDGRFAPSGLAGDYSPSTLPDVLDRGTLMFETHLPEHTHQHDLFGGGKEESGRSIMFRGASDIGITMEQRHQSDVSHAAIRLVNEGRAQTVRVTYAWDVASGWARLALEQPESPRPITTVMHAPYPHKTKDLRDLMLGYGNRTLSKDVLFAALSTEIVPIGAMPTLHPETPIATPDGYLFARDLRRGDTVLTGSGDIVPVLHVVRNRLPARGSFAPIRLHAPYFGLTQDIIVGAEQRLVMQGSEVEYTFGQEAVLVSARHMVNGHAASWVAPGAIVEYVQIILPGHEVLIAAGCPLESLFVGRLRRNKEKLAASVLADVPSRLLPEHAQPYHQVLRPFEAITLLDQRAA